MEARGDKDIAGGYESNTSINSDENSTVTSEVDYTEEELKKGETFKEEGNRLFAGKEFPSLTRL